MTPLTEAEARRLRSVAMARQRYLTSLLQQALAERGGGTWDQLVTAALELGREAKDRPSWYEFTLLRTVTVGQLYAGDAAGSIS